MTGWYEVLGSGSGNRGFKFVLRQRQNAQLLSLNPALVSASIPEKLKASKGEGWPPSFICCTDFLYQFSLHCKKIRRFYSKITGNQLPVHFPFFYGRQESGSVR